MEVGSDLHIIDDSHALAMKMHGEILIPGASCLASLHYAYYYELFISEALIDLNP